MAPRGSYPLTFDVKRLHPREVGGTSQLLLNAQELVILGHPIASARSPRLDLARVQTHDDIGDGGIFRLTRAVRNDARPAGPMGQLYSSDSLGKRANLVHFAEQGSGRFEIDRLLNTLHVGDQEIIPNELHLVSQPSQSSSAMPSSMEMMGYLETQST